jgi:predicted DNA-binding protein (MmcQ/YjbR family)
MAQWSKSTRRLPPGKKSFARRTVFGGVEFRVGHREVGHVHGDSLVDIPFPLPVRNELVESGAAEPHHILPKSGWVSIFLRNPGDVARAIQLLRRSYEIALASQTRATQAT